MPGVYREEFTKMDRISIDYGVMEKAEKVIMIEADFDWDDVGSWKAAAARRPTETEGLTECVDTEDSLVISTDDHLVATFGVKGLVVVHTPDATLIVPKEEAEGPLMRAHFARIMLDEAHKMHGKQRSAAQAAMRN